MSNDLDYCDNDRIDPCSYWYYAMVLGQEFCSNYRLEIHVPSYRLKPRNQHTWTASDAVHSDYLGVWVVAELTRTTEAYYFLSNENTDFGQNL